MNIKEQLAIDPHKLDEELLYQPLLCYEYNELFAEAQHDRDIAKEALDVAKAEADKEIRNNPKTFGISKVTETSIANAVTLHSKVKSAMQTLIDSTYQFNMLKAAVAAVEHRKKALEGMITLFVSSYFAGPSEPREIPAGKRTERQYMISDKKSDNQRRRLNRKQ